MMQPMMRMGIFMLSALSMLVLGCQRDVDTSIGDRLAKMDEKLDKVLDEVKKGGGGRGGRGDRPQRPRPSPSEVYAVPIDGAPVVGSKNAKITIVEAFEFA